MRLVSVITAAALAFSTSMAPGFAQQATTPVEPAASENDDDSGGLAIAPGESDVVVEGLLIVGTGAILAGIAVVVFGDDNSSTPSTNLTSTTTTN